MANLKKFERVFREEVLTKKKNGEDAPTWADVKRLVKEKKLFNEVEMQDSDFKSQLKETATNIALEIMSTTQDDIVDEPRVERNTKKRKPESAKGERSPSPRKKVKKEESKTVQKRQVIDSDSDVGDKSPKLGRKPTKGKKNLPAASESDTEGPNVPPESPEVRNIVDLMVYPNVTLHSNKDLGQTSKGIPAAAVAEMDDSDLSVLEDGSPVKNKASKPKGKGKEKEKVKNISKKEKDTKSKAKDDKK
ncbi:4220_t:CDS:2, partial [Acaulospora colombiana]